jgi:hypothetical protein
VPPAYNYNCLERIDQFWDVSLDPDNPNESFFEDAGSSFTALP